MFMAKAEHSHLPEVPTFLDRPEDFLSPEQRIEAIATLLATIALRENTFSDNTSQ